MHHRDPAKPDAEVLPDPVAAQLLARASELDAAHRTGAAVSDLRAAAAEAGISSGAFDAALAELHDAGKAPVTNVSAAVRRRPRMWILAVVAALILVSGVVMSRSVVPSGVADPAAAPMVDEAIVLRCLSPEDAADLVRPLLRLPTNTIVASARASRVLRIRATPEQMQNVRSLLDQHEAAGAPACNRLPASK